MFYDEYYSGRIKYSEARDDKRRSKVSAAAFASKGSLIYHNL